MEKENIRKLVLNLGVAKKVYLGETNDEAGKKDLNHWKENTHVRSTSCDIVFLSSRVENHSVQGF